MTRLRSADKPHPQAAAYGDGIDALPRSWASTLETSAVRLIRAAVREELVALEERLKPPPNRQSEEWELSANARFISPKDAANRLGITAGTVRTWIAKSKLRAHYAGRLLRIRTSDLDAFMAAQRTSGELVDVDEKVRSILSKPRRTRPPR